MACTCCPPIDTQYNGDLYNYMYHHGNLGEL